jgi:hypothetical protein
MNISEETAPGLGRRRLLTSAAAGIGGSVLLAMTGPAARASATVGGIPAGVPSRGRQKSVLRNAGAGMHVGPDTAMGVSTFTINSESVSCGVGSLGNSPGAVPMTATLPSGLQTTGPFTMMMYAVHIDSYAVHKADRQLVARGTMRSITNAANSTIEDVEHPFVAVAQDNRGTNPDLFHLHFLTPFWNPESNPMATRSTLNKAWAMFGSAILLGEINVG